jgi:glycosyltransferase involved in cell wall biosynthesis
LKILLLNQTFYPDVVSTAQHLSELASALAERGHEVTVTTGRRAYDEPDKLFDRYENWCGVRIFRCFSTSFGKSAKWRRAVDFASFIFFCCARLTVLPRHDVVMALTSPPLISFIGAWRAKLWRAKFCYWVMDMNPDEAIAAGWLRKDSMVGKCLEWMSRFSLRSANQIIALDRFMRGRIVAKGISPEKITVIPPWSHDDEIKYDPMGREQFRKQHGLEQKFVVMYSGNHSPVHPLDTLMAVAERLQADASIHFCFVGGGSEFKRVKSWAADKKLANVLCLPYQPLNRLSGSLSAADAHVVVMGAGFVGLVHPCKIYNVLTVGAPVIYIGPTPSHVTEVFVGANADYPWIGIVHGEVTTLTHYVEKLPPRLTENQKQLLPELKATFSKSNLLPELIKTIEKMGQN